jgi:hypothetical protein
LTHYIRVVTIYSICVPRNLTVWRLEYYSQSFFSLIGQTINLRNLHLYKYSISLFRKICNGQVCLLLRKKWFFYTRSVYTKTSHSSAQINLGLVHVKFVVEKVTVGQSVSSSKLNYIYPVFANTFKLADKKKTFLLKLFNSSPTNVVRFESKQHFYTRISERF